MLEEVKIKKLKKKTFPACSANNKVSSYYDILIITIRKLYLASFKCIWTCTFFNQVRENIGA